MHPFSQSSAHNDFGRNDFPAAGHVRILYSRHQHSCRHSPHRPRISFQAVIFKAEYIIFIQLVKRHDTDVLFQFDLLFYTSFDKTDRCKIVGCKIAGGSIPAWIMLFRSDTPFLRYNRPQNKAGVDLKAAVLQCFYIASVAFPYHFVFLSPVMMPICRWPDDIIAFTA